VKKQALKTESADLALLGLPNGNVCNWKRDRLKWLSTPPTDYGVLRPRRRAAPLRVARLWVRARVGPVGVAMGMEHTRNACLRLHSALRDASCESLACEAGDASR